ncbi:MAG: hypothetical protein WA824_18865 [Candidatus Sulfotelmatobacter sp.]
MELNPLSNPLLGANLGRWAEVYFTNPPQRREQAIAILLRELEIESEAKAGVPERNEAALTLRVEPPPQQKPGVDCIACGHRNPEGQSFCGMCGVPLTNAAVEHDFEMTQPAPLPEEPDILEEHSDEHLDPVFARDAHEPLPTHDSAAEEDNAISNQTARSEDSDLPSFARRPEPSAYRYRVYVGIALAILLGGLIYVAKSGDVSSDGQQSPDAKVIPAPQLPTPQQPTPIQPAPNPPAAQNSASNTPLPIEKTEKSEKSPLPKVEGKLPPGTFARNQPAPGRPAAQLAARTPAAPPPAIAEGQGGAADFAEAQRYLGGTQGAVRDLRQALPLLWDAVAQGNASATLVLSDLYLRGDGVAQNCDQARLLLDIAARKGAKGAGERLRHLQAFGCR